MKRTGFVLAELMAVVVVVLVVCAVFLPLAHRRAQMSKLDYSRSNIRQILAAHWAYRNDAADRVPMRGHRYNNGQIADAWNTWNFGGKNCSKHWATASSGRFDEPAYARPLNRYLTSQVIPIPSGYENTGAGSTWNFRPGTPTPEDRLSLDIPVFRSPGDTRSFQRSWPVPTPTVTGYNDVGTSYILNMLWWDYQPGLPPGFTAKYDYGTAGIRLLGQDHTFVWVMDQMADIVANAHTGNYPGEFGGANKSVLGFLDGRAEYMTVLHQTLSGPGYTFAFK